MSRDGKAGGGQPWKAMEKLANPEKGRQGSLLITYPRQMGIGKAKQYKVKVVSTMWFKVNLQPSQFIEELVPTAPKPEAA